MSVLATTWAWEQELPSHLKLVLLSLADHSDDYGLCWPSVECVAKKCGLDERNVRRNLRELERRGGALVREFRPGRSTHYRLLLTRPKTPHLAEHPGQSAPPSEKPAQKQNSKRGGRLPRASTPPAPGVHAPPPRASTPPRTIKEPSQNRHPSPSSVPSEPSKAGRRPEKSFEPKPFSNPVAVKNPKQSGLFPGAIAAAPANGKPSTGKLGARRAPPREPPPELKDCPLFLADAEFSRYAWGRLNAWKKQFCRVNDWALAFRYAHASARKQVENGHRIENVPGFLEEFFRWYQRELLRTDAKDLAEDAALEKREDRAARIDFTQGRRGSQAGKAELPTAGEVLAGIARAAITKNGAAHG